jgi:hypothetical protein
MGQPNFWTTAAALVVLALTIAVGLWAMLQFRESARESGPSASDRIRHDDLLGPLKAAYEAGQMDPAEYERIRARLEGGRGLPVRPPSEAQAPAPAPAAEAPATEAAPEPPVTGPSSSASSPATD